MSERIVLNLSSRLRLHLTRRLHPTKAKLVQSVRDSSRCASSAIAESSFSTAKMLPSPSVLSSGSIWTIGRCENARRGGRRFDDPSRMHPIGFQYLSTVLMGCFSRWTSISSTCQSMLAASSRTPASSGIREPVCRSVMKRMVSIEWHCIIICASRAIGKCGFGLFFGAV